jgi:choline dehydrogenase
MTKDMTTYDFIVVGAGSAGCAVAGRLAAESAASVMLIEAGGSERRLTTRVPLLAPLQYGTSLDWAYETEREPGCADRRIAQPRGRVLGGCSAMNAMAWIKGSNLDYDGWQLPGWGWDDVAPVFSRIEDGPMHITRSPYPDELSHRFVASARATGVAANDDVSGPELDGAAITPVNIHQGQRWSAARGYLRDRNNLTVATLASVDRVIIRNGRAVGIEYRRRGRVHQAFANQEVILSAGAFGTPQLLQVSGIGPADHLRRVGVTPLVDSPRVGQGLADHPMVWAVWSPPPAMSASRTSQTRGGCCSGCYVAVASSPVTAARRWPISGRRSTPRHATFSWSSRPLTPGRGLGVEDLPPRCRLAIRTGLPRAAEASSFVHRIPLSHRRSG